jgi:hypothetical protein
VQAPHIAADGIRSGTNPTPENNSMTIELRVVDGNDF